MAGRNELREEEPRCGVASAAGGARTRLLLIATLVAVITSAIPVFAQSQDPDDPNGDQPPPSELDESGPGGQDPDQAPPTEEQGSGDDGADPRQNDGEHEPRAEELTASEAKTMIKSEFGEILDSIEADPLVPEEDEVVRYTSDFTAIIKQAAGEGDPDSDSALVQSILPIRVEADDGGNRPLDLGVERTGQSFRTEAALVPVAIPRVLGDGVVLPDQEIGVEFVGLDASAAGSRLEDESVVYPNVADDTDLMLAPIHQGVEAFWQVRSSLSPESYSLDLDLPQGQALAPAPGGGFEIEDGDEVVGFISSPVAVDESGAELPVSMTESEGRLSLTLDHRSREVDYPVMIDPAIESYQWKGSGQATGFSEWTMTETPSTAKYTLADACASGWDCYSSGAYRGLYITATRDGNAMYNGGDKATWSYRVAGYPTKTTYIDYANLTGIEFHKRESSFGTKPRLEIGLYDLATGSPAVGTAPYQDAAEKSNFTYTHTRPCCYPPGNADEIRFSVEVPNTSSPFELDKRREAYLGNALIHLVDNEEPTISVQSSGLPSAVESGSPQNTWYTRVQASHTFSGTDPSLGVQRLQARIKNRGQSQDLLNETWQASPSCTGTKSSPCPSSFGTRSISYDSNNWPEGSTDVTLSAFDAGGRSKSKGFTINIDRSPPTLNVSGPLRDPAVAGNALTVSSHDDKDLQLGNGSGVAKVEIFVDGERKHLVENPLASNVEFRNIWQPNFTWSADAFDYFRKNPDVEVVSTDFLGHEKREKWTVNPASDLGDEDPIVERIVGADIGAWTNAVGGRALEAYARDRRQDQNGSDRGISAISVKLPSSGRQTRNLACAGGEGCPGYVGEGFEYSTADLADGVHQGGARAKAPDGKVSKLRSFELKIDRGAPAITKFEALPTVLDPNTSDPLAYNIKVDATDGIASPQNDADRRSGVRMIEVFVRGERRFGDRYHCPGGNCAAQATFVYRPSREDLIDLGGGQALLADIKAVVTDGAGNVAERDTPTAGTEPIATGVNLATQARERGLEQYFQYDSVETGASGGHVNLGTGNFTFHKVPTVNPGRGLSSVVNLTYNSDDHSLSELVDLGGTLNGQDPTDDTKRMLSGLLADLGIGYNEVGSGFSASISGLTRINEPLGGVFTAQLGSVSAITAPGAITLTDPDGTEHTFRAKVGEAGAFEPPPGVDLRLRLYSTSSSHDERYNGNAANTGPLDSTLPQNKAKYWAITRPDGVTYFFDALGYARSIEDRNGNKIKFLYTLVNPTTGLNCNVAPNVAVAVVPGVCEPRMTQVVDAAGNDDGASAQLKAERTIEIEYFELPTGSQITDPVALASAGKIKAIVDHGDRRTELTYDSGGRLVSVKEATGTSAERATSFAYQGPELILGHKQISAITDPRGNVTEIEYYEALDEISQDLEDALQGGISVGEATSLAEDLPDRSVEFVTNRRDQKRSYDYESVGEGGPLPVALGNNGASVTDARGTERRYRFDSSQRVLEIVEVLKPAASGQAEKNRVSLLDWSQDNRVTELTEGAQRTDGSVSTSGAATTKYAYNDNGALTSVADPLGRTTFLVYGNTAGIHRSAGMGGAPSIDTDTDGFVSDLWLVIRPNENWTMLGYETVREDGTPVKATDGSTALNGNVISETDPTQAKTETAYDMRGQVKWSENQLDNRTNYTAYDPSGMPTRVVTPRGHPSLYRYDAVGNLLQAVDPRGIGSMTQLPANHPATAPYTTTLTYDALDRVTKEQVPKCSEASVCGEIDRIERTYEYDKNGNVTARVDGTGARFESDYTETDRPLEQRSPADSGDGTTRIEKVRYGYDSEDGLTEIVSPRGTATGTADDFTTKFALDAFGRRVATVRRSGQSSARDLISSYAYDLRDNIVGTALPRDNATRNVGGDGVATYDSISLNDAILRAADPARQRAAMTYDLADQMIKQVEDPANPGGETPLNLRTEWRYDLNGNMIQEIGPRGFASGADPADHSIFHDFDSRDLPTVVTDQVGNRTTTTYDAARRVVSVERPNGAATSLAGDFTVKFTYDANGAIKTRSVPLAYNQYGKKTESELDDVITEYTRDPVGNPSTIKDPRGNTFQNWFFDNGHIARTERPSWWSASWGPSSISPDPSRNFGSKPSGVVADVRVPVGGPQISEGAGAAQASMEIAPGESAPGSGASDFGQVDAEAMPAFMPRAGETTIKYDDEMRVRFVRDSRGVERELRYDPSGRISKKLLPFDGPTQIVHDFAYDQNGNLTRSTDGESNSTTFTYDAFDRLESENAPGSFSTRLDTTADREITDYRYDPNGNLERRLTPRVMDSSRLAFKFEFDPVDRLTREWNPANEDFSYTYDSAGNLKSELSPRDVTTELTYDPAQRLIALREAVGSGVERTTKFSYDANGNRTLVTAPGSDDKQSGYQERVTCTAYDGSDRAWKTTIGAEDIGDGGTDNAARTTITEYDAMGNLRRVVSPRGVDGHCGDASPYVADSSPQGGLAGASQDAAKNATVGAYDASGLLTDRYSPWSDFEPGGAATDVNGIAQKTNNEKRYVQEFRYDGPGRLTSVSESYQVGDSGFYKTDYTHFDSGWFKSQEQPSVQGMGGMELTYAYDKRGNQTLWRSVGFDAPGSGPDPSERQVKRTFHPSGLLLKRSGEVKRSASAPSEERTYSYFYNENRSLKEVLDKLPKTVAGYAGGSGCTPPADGSYTCCPRDDGVPASQNGYTCREILVQRDAAERELVVDERWNGGKDTRYAYDDGGNVTKRFVDGKMSGNDYVAGRETLFTYDPLSRETEMKVDDDRGSSSNSLRTWTTTYYPSSEVKTMDKPNGTTERHYFRADGLIESLVRETDAAGGDKTPTYTYDPNGNRTADERGTYAYNARDQLVLWDPTGDGDTDKPASYVVNGSGQTSLEKQAVGSNTVTTTSDFAGQRLVERTVSSSAGGPAQTYKYRYDDFGNTTRIVGPGAGSTEAPPSVPGICSGSENWTDSSTAYFCYDEFSRLILSKGSDSNNGTDRDHLSLYFHDGLDRRDFRYTFQNGQRSQEWRELSYIGMSEMLAREQTDFNVAKNATYDYSSEGRRVGQTTQGSPGSGTRYYATDAQGSVEALEDPQGAIASNEQYAYDPYGALDDDDTNGATDPEDDLSPRAQANPFRFQGHYYDAGIKSYDMQARQYAPDEGRFLTQDIFASIGSDLALQSDPLTQNRYVFAGGNPVSHVEFDGHCFGKRGGLFSFLCRKVSNALFGQQEAKVLRQGFKSSVLGQAVTTSLFGPPPTVPPAPPLPLPPPPDPPAGEDDSSGEYGSERADDPLEEIRNNLGETGLRAGAGIYGANPLQDGVADNFLQHYLGNSGEDKNLEPDQALEWSSAFRAQVAEERSAMIRFAQSLAALYAGGEKPFKFAVGSGWVGAQIRQPLSGDAPDGFLTLGKFYFALTGTASVHRASGKYSKPTVRISTQLHIFDRYNWGGSNPVNQDLSRLHRQGIAQDYTIRGSSQASETSVPLQP